MAQRRRGLHSRGPIRFSWLQNCTCRSWRAKSCPGSSPSAMFGVSSASDCGTRSEWAGCHALGRVRSWELLLGFSSGGLLLPIHRYYHTHHHMQQNAHEVEPSTLGWRQLPQYRKRSHVWSRWVAQSRSSKDLWNFNHFSSQIGS